MPDLDCIMEGEINKGLEDVDNTALTAQDAVTTTPQATAMVRGTGTMEGEMEGVEGETNIHGERVR